MNRQSYLDALAEQLSILPEADTQEAMAYFTEIFDEVGPDGESALIENLGSPKEAAQEVIDNLSRQEAYQKEERGVILLNEKTDDEMDSLDHEENQESTQSSDQNQWTNADYWKDFVKKQVKFALAQAKMAKEQVTEAVQNSRVNLEKKTDELVKSFKNLKVILEHLDLEVEASQEETGTLTYFISEGMTEAPIDFIYEGDTLLIKERPNFAKNVIFTFGGFSLASAQHLVVSLPKGQHLEEVVIQQKNGDTKLQKLHTKTLHVNNHRGDLKMFHCQLEEGNLQLTSGDMKLTENQIGVLTLRTSSGDMALEDTPLKNSKLEMGSGDFYFKKVSLEDVKVSATTGDIRIEAAQLQGQIQVETGSGDVRIEPYGNLNELSYTLKTGSGDIRFFGRNQSSHYQQTAQNEKASLLVQTGSGDIRIG